jgi:superfamily II DNA or RNA helicase
MSTGLLEKPALGPCKMQLRPYQEEAIIAARQEFASGKKSTLIVLPTGCGKTIVFGMIARRAVERGGRVLILAHREELIEQAVNKLDMLGVEVGVEKAQSRARALFDPDVVVATVQTMQRKRLEGWAPDHFRLIVTDEAHHATADSYKRVYRHFKGALHLGVTATADRADETNLGGVFESVAYELSLWDAMTAPEPGPYLSRLKFVQCDVQIDLRDIRTTAGDFNQADLEDRIRPLIDTLANAIRQEIGGRKTLVFTPDVGSAQAMATALSSLGLVAEWVAGDDPDRKGKVERLHAGETQVLCNCALLTEGFDSPAVSAIALCRPTKSRPLYAQMVGRGTRLSPGKADCLLVDFNYLTAKHDLVTPAELFDTTRTDTEVIEIANEIAKEKPGTDLLEAIAQAREEKQRRTVLRVRARERNVSYRKVSYDPLSVFDTMGIPWRGNKDAVIRRASPGQVKYLQESFGVQDAPNMSQARASTLIDYLNHRRKAGLASMKQVSWMIAKGIEPERARAMSKQEASETLDRLFGKEAG